MQPVLSDLFKNCNNIVHLVGVTYLGIHKRGGAGIRQSSGTGVGDEVAVKLRIHLNRHDTTCRVVK